MLPVANAGVRQRLLLVLDELQELQELFSVTIHGMRIVRKQRGLIDILYKDGMPLSEEDLKAKEKSIKLSEKREVFINKLEEKNYTILTEMHTVYLWSKLDNLIRDILTEYISLDKLGEFKIPNINLPISILSLNEREQKYYIVSQIEQKLDIPLKQGIAKFETMLKIFDLGGSIPKKLSDKLFELSNMRNIIVHNNSHADERILNNCPWLGYDINQRINIDMDSYMEYHEACVDYVIHLIYRFLREDVPEDSIAKWKEQASASGA